MLFSKKMNRLLGIVKEALKKVANIQTFFIFTGVYILIIPLFVLLFTVFKHRLVDRKNSWLTWQIPSETLKDLERQF